MCWPSALYHCPRPAVCSRIVCTPCRFWLVLAAIALAGCTTLTPAEQESVQDAQGFLDATSRAYDVQKVTLMLGSAGLGDAATIRPGGLVTIGQEYLAQPDVRDAVLAHEMAHLILGHMDRPPDSRDAREQREIEADVKSVEILRRVRGMSPKQAFAFVTTYVLTLKKSLDQGGRVHTMGHGHPCRKVESPHQGVPAPAGRPGPPAGRPSLGRCR